MGNSLQDQLLKAGLVSQDDIDKAEAEAERVKAAKAAARRKSEARRADDRRGGRKNKSQARRNGAQARGDASDGGPASREKTDDGRPVGKGKGRRGQESRRRASTEGADARKSRPGASGATGASDVKAAEIRPDTTNMSVGLRSAKRRTEDLIKDGKLRSHSPEKREREVKRQRIMRIIERNRQDVANAELVHNFVRGSRIKSVYFTAEQRSAFMAGELAIVAFEGRHSIVSGECIQELLAIDSELFVERHDTASESTTGEEDGYPPVPDDITW